jgi:hypothetical protein
MVWFICCSRSSTSVRSPSPVQNSPANSLQGSAAAYKLADSSAPLVLPPQLAVQVAHGYMHAHVSLSQGSPHTHTKTYYHDGLSPANSSSKEGQRNVKQDGGESKESSQVDYSNTTSSMRWFSHPNDQVDGTSSQAPSEANTPRINQTNGTSGRLAVDPSADHQLSSVPNSNVSSSVSLPASSSTSNPWKHTKKVKGHQPIYIRTIGQTQGNETIIPQNPPITLQLPPPSDLSRDSTDQHAGSSTSSGSSDSTAIYYPAILDASPVAPAESFNVARHLLYSSNKTPVIKPKLLNKHLHKVVPVLSSSSSMPKTTLGHHHRAFSNPSSAVQHYDSLESAGTARPETPVPHPSESAIPNDFQPPNFISSEFQSSNQEDQFDPTGIQLFQSDHRSSLSHHKRHRSFEDSQGHFNPSVHRQFPNLQEPPPVEVKSQEIAANTPISPSSPSASASTVPGARISPSDPTARLAKLQQLVEQFPEFQYLKGRRISLEGSLVIDEQTIKSQFNRQTSAPTLSKYENPEEKPISPQPDLVANSALPQARAPSRTPSVGHNRTRSTTDFATLTRLSRKGSSFSGIPSTGRPSLKATLSNASTVAGLSESAIPVTSLPSTILPLQPRTSDILPSVSRERSQPVLFSDISSASTSHLTSASGSSLSIRSSVEDNGKSADPSPSCVDSSGFDAFGDHSMPDDQEDTMDELDREVAATAIDAEKNVEREMLEHQRKQSMSMG